MLKDIPYSELKQNGHAYKIMLLRDQCDNIFADIAKEYGISVERVMRIYKRVKIKQIRLYINYIAVTIGNKDARQIRKVYEDAYECYQDWTYACAYLEKKYKDILTEYRDDEPGMPTEFIKAMPPFRLKLSPKTIARIVEMREMEKATFVTIAKELRMTRAKAKHTYDWFYHKQVLELVKTLQEKAESMEEKDAIWRYYFKRNISSKKRYDMLKCSGECVILKPGDDKMLFDTHAHFDDHRFDKDRDELLNRLHSEGVSNIMNIGASIKTSEKSVEIAEKYDFIYAAVGVHPDETRGMTEKDIDALRCLAENGKVKAIGEIGLDYHYDEINPDEQKKWFRRQIELARELDMPIIIHDRDSKGECIDILDEMEVHNAVMHCFSGSAETARRLVKMGFMVSFTGVLTFKNARRAVEACREIPLERLMIETDCPYMAPEPHRGERNHSGYVRFVAEKMAEIKGVSYDELTRITVENGKRFFNIQ